MEKIKSKYQFQKELYGKVRLVSIPRPCYHCGQPGVYGFSYDRNGNIFPYSRIYCSQCLQNLIQYKVESLYMKALIINRFAIEKAVDDLEKAGLFMSDYRVIDTITKLTYNIENGIEHYESRAEIKAAIVLMLNGILFTTSEKYMINGHAFRIDFKIPDKKIILEIDGDLYSLYDTGNEIMRDVNIVAEEGPDWEVVRVPTYIVDKYPFHLLEIMCQGKNYLQALRSENKHGQLPPRYLEKLYKMYNQLLNSVQNHYPNSILE